MKFMRKSTLGVACAALVLTTPMPLVAADVQHPVSAKSGDGVVTSTADYWGRRRWRHRDRIDGGDVLTGIGILAGIAIIADAASKADNGPRRRREERPVYRDNAPSRYEDEPRATHSNDLGSAVTACTDAAERSAGGSARVQEIGSVTRNGDGWRVEGSLDRGANRGFSCSTSGGRVDEVRMDEGRI
jgi:hypothetical protein